MSVLYRTPILMYHSLETGVPEKSFGKMIVPAAQFENEMAYLARQKWPSYTISDFVQYREKIKKTAVLTFDDGFKTVFTYAYPVLKRYHLKATFFIATENIGKAGYMTWSDVREIAEAGFEIGSHSKTHVWLPKLSEAEAREEIFDSKERIENEIRKPVYSFSYPLGGLNEKIVEWVKEAGYRAACATKNSFSFAPDNPWTLVRIKVSPGRFSWPAFRVKSSGYGHLFR
jgi:peptidoglycan/xylan/chitin deacetylase (PgdA/CDA1 family)